MDGNSPRGEAEIKTATVCTQRNGERQVAFSLRASQRRVHALPFICISLGEAFLRAFQGRRILLPDDAAEIASHIDDVYLIPLSAYPSPERCFIIPHSSSGSWPIRAIQRLFRTDYPGLRDLGVDGLCRLRAIFDEPEKVRVTLQYVEMLSGTLSGSEFKGYQLDPHRLLADAEAFSRGVSLNDRVAEAIALRVLTARRRQREREKEEAERELERHRREQEKRWDAALRQELAWAFLGVLTLAAGHPVSAVDMRWKYGLRRDTSFPPNFNREARARGIAVCIHGERRRVGTATGIRERRVTNSERATMKEHVSGWIRLIRLRAGHEFASGVLEKWRQAAATDDVAAAALDAIDKSHEASGPRDHASSALGEREICRSISA